MPKPCFLISIHPAYVKQIYAGTKKFELRRAFANVNGPFMAYVYETVPKKAITSRILFETPIRGTPEQVMDYLKVHQYPVDQSTKDYYGDRKEVVALPIKLIHQLSQPLTLSRLKEQLPSFFPPQSYYILSNPSFSALKLLLDEKQQKRD